MRRSLFLIPGVFSLLVGGLIYILFRPDTFIYTVVSCVIPLSKESLCNCPFIQFYFPDALWAFSLGCFLSTLLKNQISLVLVVAGYGIVWELAQMISIISGTADWIDVGMYVIAALAVVGINHILKEKSK